MIEIQRLLTETIDGLNVRGKHGDKPRLSISFTRRHPELFIGIHIAWFATLVVMLQSEALVDSVWLLVVLFVVPNGFFFFDVAPRHRFEDIDVLDFRVCYGGEWYNIRSVLSSLIDIILYSPSVDSEHKAQPQKMISCKGELSFYDVFTFARAQASR